jgi:sugar phosphate isomerase/epimerase
VLADLFHMNIEESNLADAIRTGGNWIDHIHFVDSNRWPAGSGHTDFDSVAAALKEIEFDGVVCAEAFPLPDSLSAAEATMQAFNRHFR